nr:hypothetical protein [Serratia fonticola]
MMLPLVLLNPGFCRYVNSSHWFCAAQFLKVAFSGAAVNKLIW